jgi:hypothetical protein
MKYYKKKKIMKVRQLRDCVIILNNYFKAEHKIHSDIKQMYFRETTYRYDVPFARNQYGKRTRKHKIPTIFNEIPAELLQLKKIKEVKKRLLNYYLKQ